ncbi:hypothetical protein [Luteolibacter marinus]|uniref:hypothetical protein n=1 Tax=Luteolibacter marinus TaxID=2776705 RepID=UPI001868C834|nr:hypothetical protein [Luteolibacter marinus]
MLPERRKSAEEIAKLRESIGVPGSEPVAAEKASEPEIPVTDVFEPAPAEEESSKPVEAKPVRSLRKSEQQPGNRKRTAPAKPGAPIPVRRHSDRELMEMRRVQATPPDQSIAYVQQLAVPWPFILFGYLLPLSGALVGWFAAWAPGVPEPNFIAGWLADLSRQPWLGQAGFGLLIGFCVLSLAAAGWIALKKPRSRHHAGFICILAVLVSVFGLIHQLTPTYGP